MLRTRLQTDAATGAARPWRRTLGSITQEGAAGRGMLNLWRGTSATVLRVGGGAAVHFYVLESLRAREDEVPWSKPVRNTFFGGVSRGAAVVLLCPITTVKTRMEASGAAAAAYAYRSVPHGLVSVVRAEGPLALWRGLAPALLSTMPFSAVHYAAYSALRDELGRRREPGQAPKFLSGEVFACGAAASVLATCITQPFDVMRTRAMLELDFVAPMVAPTRPQLAALAAGLMAGVGPRLAKRTLQTATIWTIYEELAPRARWLLNR